MKSLAQSKKLNTSFATLFATHRHTGNIERKKKLWLSFNIICLSLFLIFARQAQFFAFLPFCSVSFSMPFLCVYDGTNVHFLIEQISDFSNIYFQYRNEIRERLPNRITIYHFYCVCVCYPTRVNVGVYFCSSLVLLMFVRYLVLS